eukprot:Lithocolla_globosa_v1_NODE_3978_length_1537_cov_692.281861.p2 type:complete len:181 gc:universal NODE_3978_length_1537_cov_692.281861:746-1288(+)
MPNYSKGKIYKIACDEIDDVYVGSTSQPLSHRMGNHQAKYRRWKDGKCHFTTSFDIIKYDSAQIILIEDFPCERKEQLHARERHWIEQTVCVNKVIPTRTDKEYYQDNRERIIEQGKQYWQDNREKINSKSKQYHQANKERINEQHECECGGRYTTHGKVRHFKTKKHQQYLNSPPNYEE